MTVENTDSFGNYLIHGIDEVIVPDAIGWWPSAPGWQVLGVILSLLLVARVARWAKLWWRNRYRREALRQLDEIQKRAGSNRQQVVAVLPHFIKVTALQAYPRRDVAGLSGVDWLAFLDAHYSGPSFSMGVGKELLSVAYLPQGQWQLDDQQSKKLINMTRQWIATHQEVVCV